MILIALAVIRMAVAMRLRGFWMTFGSGRFFARWS
jgi:hypothetical protein